METMNMELDEMRQQLSIFKAKLDSQQIVNDKLVREIIKGKMDVFRRTIRTMIALMIFLVVNYAFLWWNHTISWQLALYTVVITGISAYLEIKNSQQSMLMGDDSLVSVSRRLLQSMRSRHRQLLAGIPFLIIFLVWIVIELAQDMAGRMGVGFGEVPRAAWYGALLLVAMSGTLGCCVGLMWHKKLQKRSRELVAQIEELGKME